MHDVERRGTNEGAEEGRRRRTQDCFWADGNVQERLHTGMKCIGALNIGRESGDRVNLIKLSMIHESLLFIFNSSKNFGSTTPK